MPKENAHAGKSLFAGVVAGGIEGTPTGLFQQSYATQRLIRAAGFLTYPAEYAKTVSQFQSKGNAKVRSHLAFVAK